MSFIKFISTAVLGVLIITLPAIYLISGEMTWTTVLEVVIPFTLALIVIYFFTGLRKTEKGS
ncbi:hypothetical protein [Shouchella patagoniensis]|uniref:hypothetical protein n=1 Tax=Shouchella patagoniensis TaxID=228576 RepID=UPI00099552C6|nr:hypothetical protein [Shouchella patagoniensis]